MKSIIFGRASFLINQACMPQNSLIDLSSDFKKGRPMWWPLYSSTASPLPHGSIWTELHFSFL